MDAKTRTCRVCFKPYRPDQPHDVMRHEHQGQGPTDSARERAS